MDLFAELDKEYKPAPRRRPQSRAQKEAIARKRMEQEEIASGVEKRPRLMPAGMDPQCSAPCPTILAPADHPDLCPACVWVLERHGVRG